MEQLIDFPKRGDNILDLVLSTMPGQIHDIHSPDQLSDHEVVACSLSVYIKPTKTLRRKYFLYNKGNYDQMREETKRFCKEKYFNGNQNSRNVEEADKVLHITDYRSKMFH
jgi:hypothetical protein